MHQVAEEASDLGPTIGLQVSLRASAYGGEEDLSTPEEDTNRWCKLQRHTDNSDAEQRRRHNYIRFKFVSSLMKIKRDYRRVGGTLFMTSYPEYLRVRDKVAGHYEVHLAEDHERWAEIVGGYIAALQELPSSRNWSGLHWVGSTAVNGLIAKPIVDLMITTREPVEATLLAIAEETKDAKWRTEKSGGLTFPIGFFGSQAGVDWGFLQMPTYHALLHNIVECNLHIFPDGEQVATEKITMRDFLNSEEGMDLRKRYSQLKKDLEQSIKRGDVLTQEYNKGKHVVIQEILEAAEEWKVSSPKASQGAWPEELSET